MNWSAWRMGVFVSALTGGLTGLVGMQMGLGWKNVLFLTGMSAAKDVLLYLKNHPIVEPAAAAVKSAALSVLLLGGFLAVNGCAGLAPGADPVVVRAEQVETTAKATTDFVLKLDDSDRGFWRTNAAAFHNFCEWLRTPVTVDATNELPRASALIWNVDEAKIAYVHGGSSSNTVLSAVSVLETVMSQASSWCTIVTNRPPL